MNSILLIGFILFWMYIDRGLFEILIIKILIILSIGSIIITLIIRFGKFIYKKYFTKKNKLNINR